MSETVIVAAIAGFATMGAAGFAFLGILVQRGNGHARKAARDSARARVQLENDHTTNLREEGDQRHDQNLSKLDQIIADIGGIRSDIRRLNRRDDSLSDRLDTLSEHTIPKGHPEWPSTPQPTPPPEQTPGSGRSAPSPRASRSTSSSPWAPPPPPPSRP